MKIKFGRWVWLVLGAVLVAGSIGFAVYHATTAQGAAIRGPAVACSGAKTGESYLGGVPAIPVPHSGNGGVTTSGTPRLTLQDVRNYVQGQTTVFRGTIVGTPKIASIRLMTLCQVAAFLKQPRVTLTSSNLYYVVVWDNQGNFPAPTGTSNVTRDVYEIFDAYTGNLLVAGGQR